MCILQTKYIVNVPDPSKLGIERHTEKIFHYKIITLYYSIHKLLQNFIYQNFVYYRSSFMKVRIHNPSGSLHYDLPMILTLGQYICLPFPFFFFPLLSFPKHSSKLYQLICKIHWTLSLIFNFLLSYHIYPTPPLGQDMTQGQFLSGV